MQPDYVKERLSALDDIDLKLCSMLQQASHVVHSYSEVKSGNQVGRPQFEKYVSGFYTDLEEATVKLRNEIKLLDDNIGTRLLPINVNKKALGQDDEKLAEQISLLKSTLSGRTYKREVTPAPEENTSPELKSPSGESRVTAESRTEVVDNSNEEPQDNTNNIDAVNDEDDEDIPMEDVN